MKYWLLVDGHKIYDFETLRPLTGREEEEIEYEYAKQQHIGGKGVEIKLARVQTQKDFPVYKMRQG